MNRVNDVMNIICENQENTLFPFLKLNVLDLLTDNFGLQQSYLDR